MIEGNWGPVCFPCPVGLSGDHTSGPEKKTSPTQARAGGGKVWTGGKPPPAVNRKSKEVQGYTGDWFFLPRGWGHIQEADEDHGSSIMCEKAEQTWTGKSWGKGEKTWPETLWEIRRGKPRHIWGPGRKAKKENPPRG